MLVVDCVTDGVGRTSNDLGRAVGVGVARGVVRSNNVVSVDVAGTSFGDGGNLDDRSDIAELALPMATFTTGVRDADADVDGGSSLIHQSKASAIDVAGLRDVRRACTSRCRWHRRCRSRFRHCRSTQSKQRASLLATDITRAINRWLLADRCELSNSRQVDRRDVANCDVAAGVGKANTDVHCNSRLIRRERSPCRPCRPSGRRWLSA